MISALFVEFADYRWIFWFTTIVGIPAALLCVVLIPSQDQDQVPVGDVAENVKERFAKLRRLDLVGVIGLTGASILSTYSQRPAHRSDMC